ncbi:hypothetical protein PR003_g7022 [Phytophthora rubi]|uniref:Uncharacterized protein n=1 Tax=Phytophthora rubi TaxID=129364 RepID=A0A6A4FNM5_9STRA|nr:hypothetical protein PR003_g7022 [Phytophthora rubi]
MRYQLFRRGLNNRRMLAILDSSPARDLPEACEWLMVKDMYRPVDEDEDFEDTTPAKSAAASETPALLKPMVDQVKALAQEVRSFVKDEKEWRTKVNNELRASPQPHYAMQTMASSANNRRRRNRSREDSREATGTVVAGARSARPSNEDGERRGKGEPLLVNGSEGNGGREEEKNAAVAVPESVVSVKRNDETETKRGRTWVYRAADAELAEPKDGDEVKECPVVGVGAEVKESPVVRVDEPEGMAVLKEVVACPEANEFVEEKADDKLKESIDQVEIVIAVNETVAERLKEGVGVSVPEPEDGSGLRTVLDEGDKAELAGETVPDGADEDERGCTVEPLPLKRLFSDDELDAMEKCTPGQEVTVLVGTEVAVETEEYEKELEDRLYPLDEVELQERVKKIAATRKKLSIEEMASYLGLPVDVLERTKGASTEEMTSPEYWQDWFEKTLKSSTEAKRANRDFRDASTVPEPQRTHSTSVVVERFGLPPEGVREKKKNMRPKNEMNAKETEAVVYSNIGVPAIDGSGEDSAVKNRAGGEEPTVETSPLVIRALGRRAVYEWLTKVRNEGTPLEPSHRDQVPEVDWVQLLAVTAELTKRDSVPLPDWVTFSEWVECYHSKCGELVWKKLLEHKADETIPNEEKEPRTRRS